MRFHIGFSKRINIKSLISLLGALFVGLIAFFGLSQIAYADSWTTNFNYLNYSSNPTFNYVQFLDHSARPITTDSFKSSIQWGNSFQSNIENYCPNGKCPITILYNKNNGNMYENNFYFKSSINNINVGEWSQPNGLFDRISIPLNLNFLCAEGNNSVSLRFKFRSISPNYANTNLIKGPFLNYGPIVDINDYLGATIETVYDDEQYGPNPERQCYFTNMITDPFDSDFVNYDLTCPGLPVDSNLLSYNIKFYSKYLLNLTYDDLLKENSSENITFYSGGWDQISYTLDYSCSFNPPVDPNTDSLGQSNINFDAIDGTYFAYTEGNPINTSFWNIAYPNTFTQFLQFPLYIASAIVNNRNQCQPININFSSITQKWGNFNYVLQLPCLSSTIQSVFGAKVIGNTTLYNIIDMFIAFYLLYKLATRCVVLIDMMMTGQDMTGYLFSGTEQVVESSVDDRTGEVKTKTRKRVY